MRRILVRSLVSAFVAVFSIVAVTPLPTTAGERLRIGQFNIQELSTAKLLETDASGAGTDPQALAAAAIIQELAPDILIVNELDADLDAAATGADLALNARRFNDLYLRRGPRGVDYPYVFAAPCNTGILAGKDFNNDGVVATVAQRDQREHGGDCFGFGNYPGQYAMAVLSRYPLEAGSLRSWQRFRWVDLPDNLIPPGWFDADELALFRLSSKSHWDLLVRIGEVRLHLLVSHPTPTGYDGPEDLNGRRNYDELRLWAHYLDADSVLVDDAGWRGGLAAGERFVIAGDLNADPRGDVMPTGRRAIEQLLQHPRVQDSGAWMTSAGALAGRAPGPPDHIERHTAAWEGGGLRIDYILPSAGLTVLSGGVYWPDAATDPAGAERAALASDHRMTWLDLRLD